MPVLALDHVQPAMLPGRNAEARAFHAGLFGLIDQANPPALAAPGGCWSERGAVKVHLRVEPDFAPARKPHPAFPVDNLTGLAARLAASGHPAVAVRSPESHDRLYARGPFRNRVELMRCRTALPR